MITKLIVLVLVVGIFCQGQSQSRIAKIDEIQIDLAMNESKLWNQSISQHQNLAFMINIQPEETNTSFGQLEINMQNKINDKVSCTFKYPNNICVLQRCTQNVSIKVKCLKQKCKAKLSISQRLLYHYEGVNSHKSKMLTVPGQIYKVQKQNFSSLIEVHLEKRQDRLLENDVTIYANVHVFSLSQVEELETNTLVFGLKPIKNNNDQYIYIEGDQAAKNKELRFKIITHFDELKEGTTIMDFIETYGRHSNNTYHYKGSFTKNIQVKVRVFAPKQNKNLPFSVTLSGKVSQNDAPNVISRLELNPIEFGGHKFFDITFMTTKSRHEKYKIIDVELGIQKVQDKAIFVQIGVSDVSISDILISDHVYFSTSQNQELNFAVSPQVKYQIVGLDKEISVLTKAAEKYSVNTQTCSLHKGCEIYLKAQKHCEACSFVFDIEKEDIKNNIIYYQVKDNQIEAKIDIQQQLYFKYQMNPKNYSQIVVNTANVMVYAQFEDYNRCKIPSSVCHQFVLNQQNPIIIQNQKDKPQNLIVSIVGLEKTTFKLRFIQEINGLQVKVGEKFSYLFDAQEKEIKLKLQLKDNTFQDTDEHLYFNLLAPTNSLLLIVKNEDGQEMTSTDGYVEFPRKSIRSKKFDIDISKVGDAFMQQYVHMTLIVSTAEYGVKLDATTTHYEKYLPNSQKKFIMEYQSTEQNVINIYTQNLQKSHSTMLLSIRYLNQDNPDQQNKPFIEKELQRDNQVIDLDFQLENLDICEEINCELEVTIKNKANIQLEQSIIILHSQSVISIDDSIWNSYEINQLSKTNHFFYIPRDVKKTITILFSSEDRNLYIDYVVYNNKGNHNPQNWPWERHSNQMNDNITSHLTGFQEFRIPPEAIQECWPNCVILITLTEFNKEKSVKESLLIKTYKILVSSTIIQVPEDVKFEITMKTDEQNSMFIEIKNFLNTKQLTFFTQTKVGRAKVVASLINRGEDYKLGINKDFVFDQLQTNLPMELITTALKNYELKAQSTLLKITFIAESNVKMYFQFTSALKNIYKLNMDDLQVCTLKTGEEVWYEFVPERDFSIKFYRAKGFPLFKIIKCQEQSFLECLSKQKQLIAKQLQQKLKLQQKTKQQALRTEQKEIEVINEDLKQSTAKDLEIFVEKNYEYMGQQCQSCIFFIWVYGYAQDLQLTINVRSSTSETEMKQLAILNDRITFENGYHKYLINAEPELMTIITFRVMEGSCYVVVSDNEMVLYDKNFTSDKDSYGDIKIYPLGLPSSPNADDSSQDNPGTQVGRYNAKNQNKHHILRHLHVKVVSRSKRPIEYILSYSVGFSGIFLQDGSISQKYMMPNVPHTFFYHNNDKSSHPFLSLSSSVLPNHEKDSTNEFQTRFFYYPDKSNRNIKQQFKPQMPPKKNANNIASTLTHVYELPAIYELYQIQVYSKNYIKLTASINHKEIVYLPLGYEYLIKLHPNESIYLVVERPESEFLQLTIKKCDTSVPNLLYTNDAKQFQKGLYEVSQDVMNSYDKRLIKTKKSSKTIHLKVTAEEYAESLFTITIVPQSDPNKSKNLKIKAGNNGLLTYTPLDSNKVEIQFSPIVCETKNCNLPNAHYYLLLAKSLQNIYGQLYCAGNYLISKVKQENMGQSQIINILPQHFDNQKNVYRYKLTLDGDQQFIGVKAMYTSNNRMSEIVYVPTEVSSLWKQLAKLSFGIVILFAIVFVVIVGLVVLISTKLARRGYKPISEVE